MLTVTKNYIARSGRLLNKVVCLRGGVNSHLPARFPNCETLFIDDCDKNYVYYNLDTIHFPKVKTIYLNSHPCEYSVLHRHFLVNGKVDIFLTERWYHTYKDRWFSENGYIKPIKYEEMVEKMKAYPASEELFTDLSQH